MGTVSLQPTEADATPVEAPGPEPHPLPRGVWRAAVPSMLVVAGLFTLLFLRNHRFAFIDDRQADGLAKVVDLGRILSSGEWPWLSTNVVNSGAHAIENQYGVFNPVDLAFGLLISHMDDLALGSFLQLLTHLLLLTAAAAWLGRMLGLTTLWAIAFAVSVGFGPYTVYWGAGWYEAVTSFSWFVLALAALVALHLSGRNRYGWVLLVATYLCYQSGWPLAIPVLGLTVLVVVVARVLTRHAPATTGWILAWYGGGVLTSLVGLYPLFTNVEFGARPSSISNVANANVAPLEGLLHFANPAYHGWMNLFAGDQLQPLPHFYVAWFLLPVFCFWRFGPTVRRPEVRVLLWSSVVLLAVTALGTLGPERILVFRFPTRFLQYEGLFLLMTAAVLVAHGRPVLTRTRLLVFGGAVVLLVVNALQADPAGLVRVVGAMGVVAVLGIALVGPQAARTALRSAEPVSGARGRWVGWVAVGGTVLVMAATAVTNSHGRGVDWGLPSRQSDYASLSRSDYTLWFGSYAQFVLADGDTGDDSGGVVRDDVEIPPEDIAGYYAEYHPSSSGLYAGDRQINGYSPLGHRFLREHVPLNDHGNFGDPSAAQAFTAVDPETGLTWLELLRVDQVVAPLGEWDDALAPLIGPGWERVPGQYTASYRRAPYQLPGLLSYAAPGVTVDPQSTCELQNSRECVGVTVTGDAPARVVFARLWFPGYTATLDGKPIDIVRHSDTLVAVDLPPGASGDLVLTYRPPGFLPLSVLAVATIVGLGVAQTVYARRRRRVLATGAEDPAAEDSAVEDSAVETGVEPADAAEAEAGPAADATEGDDPVAGGPPRRG